MVKERRGFDEKTMNQIEENKNQTNDTRFSINNKIINKGNTITTTTIKTHDNAYTNPTEIERKSKSTPHIHTNKPTPRTHNKDFYYDEFRRKNRCFMNLINTTTKIINKKLTKQK